MFDIVPFLTIGGPAGILGAGLYFLLNTYITTRSQRREDRGADREDKSAERQSESGIVETVGKALTIFRGEMDRMALDIIDVRKEKDELEDKVASQAKHIREQDDKIARQDRAIEWLTADNASLRAKVDELERAGGRSS